jgi:XTP/dITP diphosphohydrolase
MIKSITVVTSNNGKFDEIKRYFSLLAPEITLNQVNLDVPEYQTMNIHTVAIGKARYAWNILKKPLIIDDGGLYIKKYNQFPGVFSKYVFEGIGLEGIWKLAQDDPRVYFLNCMVFKDNDMDEHIFEGVNQGMLIEPKNIASAHKQLPFRSIFVPEGYTESIDELWQKDQDHSINHRYKAVEKIVSFLKARK